MPALNMRAIGAASLSLLRLSGIIITLLLLSSIQSTGAAAQADRPPELGAVLAGEKNLTTFYDLIRKFPELLLQLPNLNGITIIAPTNEAFARIPLTSLHPIWDADDPAVAVPILQYHIVAGQFAADAMAPGAPAFARTLLTSPAWTNVTARGGGQLVRADKQPDGLVALTSGGGSRSSLVSLRGGPGQGQRDLAFAGGLVQAVDSLLIPPTALNETLSAYSDLSFLGALYAAGLYDEFAYCGSGGGSRGGGGNCTIFAPSVRAFRAVNSTLSSLGRDQLARVLRYHLVPDQVLTSNLLVNGTILHSSSSSSSSPPPQQQQQEELHVRRAGNYLYLNSAQVVQQDILFANGVVHLLDNVLNPDLDPSAAAAATPDPRLGTQAPVFSPDSTYAAAAATLTAATALEALPLPFTTALPCTVSCPEPTMTGGGSSADGSSPSRTLSSSGRGLQTSSSKAQAAARWTALPHRLVLGAVGVGGYLGMGMGGLA